MAGGEGHDAEVVLVVDDDAGVRQVTCKILERGGYEVLCAGGGGEALEVAREHDGRFDLLLTDIVMPSMNGRELGETLSAKYPRIRVLYMSAYTEDEVVLDGLKTSEVHFIAKPFTVEGLREKVRRVLGGRRPQA
ncbi:MAG: response regulator [Gemmatimonadota bacterium]|jgi:two-component system sensor histidine kinase EvgS